MSIVQMDAPLMSSTDTNLINFFYSTWQIRTTKFQSASNEMYLTQLFFFKENVQLHTLTLYDECGL
jgi:hypothetical protein